MQSAQTSWHSLARQPLADAGGDRVLDDGVRIAEPTEGIPDPERLA